MNKFEAVSLTCIENKWTWRISMAQLVHQSLLKVARDSTPTCGCITPLKALPDRSLFCQWFLDEATVWTENPAGLIMCCCCCCWWWWWWWWWWRCRLRTGYSIELFSDSFDWTLFNSWFWVISKESGTSLRKPIFIASFCHSLQHTRHQ